MSCGQDTLPSVKLTASEQRRMKDARVTVSDVNKDWTCKDKDMDQAYKDQDKDKDKDMDQAYKDKDFTYSYLLQVATKPTIAIKQQQ